MLILALSGKKRSGKDTLADLFVDKYNFEKVSFAESLKNAVIEDFNLPSEFLNSQKEKEKPLLDLPVMAEDSFSEKIHALLDTEFHIVNGQKYWTPRALMILEGSIKRSVKSSYWVDKCLNKLKHKNAVIPDFRYKSEVEQLKNFCNKNNSIFYTVRINRFDSTESIHPSETDLDDYVFDFVIENKFDLDTFLAQGHDLYSKIAY